MTGDLRSLFVGGVDEAGRGPLAGPVTAACVVLPPEFSNKAITDSKKLTESLRSSLYTEICQAAISYSVVSVGSRRIDILNIREATRVAMRLAVDRVASELSERFGPKFFLHILIDGNMPIATNHSQETIIKGDEKILAISAASILAKVTRDRLMGNLATKYQHYGFEVHKGYPTKGHIERITAHGVCQVHRRSFRPVREHLAENTRRLGTDILPETV